MGCIGGNSSCPCQDGDPCHYVETYCECGHVRKDHIDDGPCNIWEWPGRGLIGCQDRCQRMRPMRRTTPNPNRQT